MIEMIVAFAIMAAVVCAAGRWAQDKQARLATASVADSEQEVPDARLDR